MKVPRFLSVQPWHGMVALLLLAPCLASQERAVQHRDLPLEETERKVRSLAKQFAEILAPTPLESQLRAKCSMNCGAAADSSQGPTVAQELENIQADKRAKLSHVAVEIEKAVDEYVEGSRDTWRQGLDTKLVIHKLSQILSGVTSQPPTVFVLTSGLNRTLLVFYNVQNGLMGENSSYAVLTAFDVGATRPIVSDSTGSDMNGYADIVVKKLPSPVQGEIWLLISGYMTGANGPNCRMRVFAYDGHNFRAVWAPANVWGTFTTKLVGDGFMVSGEYYQSTRQRRDRYQLGRDGIYLAPWER